MGLVERVERRSERMGEEDMEGEWTLRKASGWAMDRLSNPFAADVIEIMKPIINVGMKRDCDVERAEQRRLAGAGGDADGDRRHLLGLHGLHERHDAVDLQLSPADPPALRQSAGVLDLCVGGGTVCGVGVRHAEQGRNGHAGQHPAGAHDAAAGKGADRSGGLRLRSDRERWREDASLLRQHHPDDERVLQVLLRRRGGAASP